MNKFRSLIALPLIALFALGIASCGGDDEVKDLDPAEVLEQTFSGEHEVNSGAIEVSMSGEVPGDEGGSGSLTVSAPFNNNGTDEVPDVDLSIDVEGEGGGESIDFSAGGTLTPEGATINFQDTDYEVPADLFEQLAEGLVEGMSQAEGDGDGNAPSLEDFGIDPLSWFTNLTNEGSEDIDGTETVHVSGDADITKVGQDIIGAVEGAGIPGAELPEGFDASQLGLLEGFIEEASFDVFSETETNLLRRLEVTIVLQNLGVVGGGEGSPDSASFEFSVTLNEPNEDQEIELPTDTKPIEDLEQALEDEFGDSFDLGGLGALGGGAVDPRDFLPGGKGGPGSGGSGGSGGLGNGPSGGEDLPGVDQEYLDCIAKANSPEELAQCAEGL